MQPGCQEQFQTVILMASKVTSFETNFIGIAGTSEVETLISGKTESELLLKRCPVLKGKNAVFVTVWLETLLKYPSITRCLLAEIQLSVHSNGQVCLLLKTMIIILSQTGIAT